MVDMAAELRERGPALRRIEELETEREGVEQALREAEAEWEVEAEAEQLLPAAVEAVFKRLAWTADTDRLTIRDSLQALLDRIELDPDSGDCRIHYRPSPLIRAKVASPRGGASDTYSSGISPLRAKLASPGVRRHRPYPAGEMREIRVQVVQRRRRA